MRCLIRRAELLDTHFRSHLTDLRICDGRVTAVGSLLPEPDETLIEANGCCLLPGLNDHHLHLAATAAARQSVRCGPPVVESADDLARVLLQVGQQLDAGTWLRGIGYHEQVAGDLDRRWLDELALHVPVRIQHRSGQLWVMNTMGLDQLRQAAHTAGIHLALPEDGRLFYQDELLGRLIPRQAPDIGALSRDLLAMGVTGVNDMTVSNDAETAAWFSALQEKGSLLQTVRLSGSPALSSALSPALSPEFSRTTHFSEALQPGDTKFYLHDHDLPHPDDARQFVADSHEQGRPVAVHCVTEAELVVALAAFREAGTLAGDRIEHGSIIPPALIEQLLASRLMVVTQPNFVFEKGDSYLSDLPAPDLPHLYRCQSLLDAGVPLAFGTDAPFGDPDPWQAMQAAVERRTRKGHLLLESERASPEQALSGFLGALDQPAVRRHVREGMPADLVLMKVPWRVLRKAFSRQQVRLTFKAGEIFPA